MYCLLLIGVLNSLVYSQVLNLNSATVEYDYKDTSTNKLFLSNVLIETDYKDTSTNKTFIQSVIVEYDYILYQDTIPPVLLSALTETTTAIILTFSEDLENSTISIDDFLITNPTVSIISAVKISSGVIRLSILPQMPTDAVPWVIIVSSISDLAGNYAVIGSSVQSKDGVSPVISGLDISLKVFSPNSDGIKDNTTIYYTLSESATTTISIYDSTNILVRTLVNSLKSAGQNSETWDGKNDAGFILPDGNYTIKIDATDLSGNKAIPVSTQTAIDNTPPGITNLSVTPSPFWPDGNGITGDKLNDITTIYYTLSDNLSYPLATTIKIYDNSNNLVKTLIDNAIKPPGSYTEPWDGTDSVGKVVIEGTYTYKISATDIAGNTTASSGTVKVDFPPVFSISAVPYTAKPTPGNPVTVTITVYSNEPLISNPTITAVDASSAPLVITGPVVSTNTYTYTTVVSTSNAEGQARINVSGTDLTGNPGTDTGYFVIDSIPDIRNVSASPDPFTPNNDGLQDTTTIQYELTIACKVTIEIKNSQGVIVKHLSTSIDEGVGYQSHL
ncbi:MAG: FlgD immunoglobulin-like domain containing protein, partial [Elusimicrobiota bacterium]